MGIKYYKLTAFKPFWIYADGKYPRQHVEEIVSEYEVPWIETKNYQWTDIDNLTATGYNEDIADYIKVDVNGQIYYYYLLNKSAVLASKNGKTQYRAVYELDEYMTSFHNKLEIMREHNPSVYCNMGFLNRWADRRDMNGNLLYYEFDYIKQRHLSNTLSDRNNMMVRKLAYSTTANDLFSLNFPDVVIPSEMTIMKAGHNEDTITLSNWESMLSTPSDRGRYRYIIAKGSSLMKTNNGNISNAYTQAVTIVIPLFAGYADSILRALNDFSLTRSVTETDPYVLNPLGDNLIGIFECDIPYSYFYGLLVKGNYGAKIRYVTNFNDSGSIGDIVYFYFNNNSPLLFKIIDFAKYQNGFYGKYLNIITHIDQWTPDTEPALLSPMYYKEEYNNGEGNIAVDASMFSFKWDSESIDEFGISAYLCWSKDLVLAYNFGENTNTMLSTFDNTETSLGKASITNFVVGSASANYYTTNANTISTGLQVRQSEEKQAWNDASLDTAKMWVNAVPDSIVGAIFQPLKTAKKIATTALDTGKLMMDTTMQQDRANKQFYSSINNLVSSPNVTLSDPSVKGVIPNKYGLFETYSKELHDEDKRVVFNSYTHNGYPINHVVLFNDVADNRKFMNIINLNTTYFEDDLMKLLTENDNTIFNTKFWNKRFLAWLNQSQAIYNSNRLINVTDYMGEDYVSNIEKVLPDTPVPKENISRFITNFRALYEAYEPNIWSNLQTDNPNAPADIWDQVEIFNISNGGFIIRSITGAEDYYGSILVNATVYNGYIQDGATKHYFFDVNFLCNNTYRISSSSEMLPSPLEWTIRCPDGKTYSNKTFNLPIVWNANTSVIINIPDGFLNACYGYHTNITIPSYINKIGAAFMYDCSIKNDGLYNRKSIGQEFGTTIIRYPEVYNDFNVTINCDANKFNSNDLTMSWVFGLSDFEGALDTLIGYDTASSGSPRNINGTFATAFKNRFGIRSATYSSKLVPSLTYTWYGRYYG